MIENHCFKICTVYTYSTQFCVIQGQLYNHIYYTLNIYSMYPTIVLFVLIDNEKNYFCKSIEFIMKWRYYSSKLNAKILFLLVNTIHSYDT